MRFAPLAPTPLTAPTGVSATNAGGFIQIDWTNTVAIARTQCEVGLSGGTVWVGFNGSNLGPGVTTTTDMDHNYTPGDKVRVWHFLPGGAESAKTEAVQA